MNDQDFTSSTPQSHSDEPAFEITDGEVEIINGLKKQRVYIEAGNSIWSIEVHQMLLPFDDLLYTSVSFDDFIGVSHIPALIAALTRAREIAEGWAAEAQSEEAE